MKKYLFQDKLIIAPKYTFHEKLQAYMVKDRYMTAPSTGIGTCKIFTIQ